MSPMIAGSTLGILGMGRIGQAIAQRATYGFGMQVLYWSRRRLASVTEARIGCTYADKTHLLQASNHVIAALPFSPETRHAIGTREFASMRQGTTFVHIGRGGVVDDQALAEALAKGHLAGAGLDVFEDEPQINVHLLRAPRLVLTPHIASATPASRIATLEQALENVRVALQGEKPVNLLNPF